jgi:hypothetical protein
MEACNTFWGSHGCDLEKDHNGPCECRHSDDLDGPGDTVKLAKLANMVDNVFVTYDESEYDGMHFGVAFYDEPAGQLCGYFTVWFSI